MEAINGRFFRAIYSSCLRWFDWVELYGHDDALPTAKLLAARPVRVSSPCTHHLDPICTDQKWLTANMIGISFFSSYRALTITIMPRLPSGYVFSWESWVIAIFSTRYSWKVYFLSTEEEIHETSLYVWVFLSQIQRGEPSFQSLSGAATLSNWFDRGQRKNTEM